MQIRKLRDPGTTIFLTTHYLEEAEALSDQLAIIDHGKIVAQGTSRELKQQIDLLRESADKRKTMDDK